MKTSEVRRLIGQEVWIQRQHDWRAHSCVILEMRGRNLLVDHQGSTDWYWLPDCRIYASKPEHKEEFLG